MANWQDHQRLAQRLYSLQYLEPPYSVQEHGKNGNAQGGIDILIRSDDLKYIVGVQCRRLVKLNTKGLAAGYAAALKCNVKLTHYWMFTSAPRNAGLQEEAVRLTKEGPIPCVLKAWDDIEEEVQRYPILFEEFWPDWGWGRGAEANSLIVHLNMPPESYMELLVAVIPDNVAHYGGKVWVSDLQRFGRGNTTSLGNTHYRLQEGFGGMEYEAFFVQSWLNQFNSTQELLALPVANKTVIAEADYYQQWVEILEMRRAKIIDMD